MNVKSLFNTLLACALVCAPAWTHSGTMLIHDTTLSAKTDFPCHARKPDRSVGKVVFHKGQATLNGAEPQVGAYIRNGDTLTTSEDGFVAITLATGELLSIQPVTHFRVICAGQTAPDLDFDRHLGMHVPHLSGAIRG